MALGWLLYSWGRDSSLVKVRNVEIKGLTTAEAPAIKRALTGAAEQMTTLHVDRSELMRVAKRYPIVQSISASADFPNTLEITVREYRPSAVVTDPGGRRVAVAEDGTLLPRMSKDKLAAVKVDDVGRSGKVTDERSLSIVQLLGQAPPGLRSKLGKGYWGKTGIRVALREGPAIEFGSPTDVTAKWLAAARVLADDSAQGAKLIDVRLPERPVAAGFLAGTQGTAGTIPADEQDDQAAAAAGIAQPVDPATDPAAAPAPEPVAAPEGDPQL